VAVVEVLIATGVVGLLFIIATVVVAVALVRGVRRRYRSVRARFLVGGAHPDPQRRLGLPGSGVAASIGSPGWWLVQGRRHRLWRAVTSAEHAVRVASEAGGAVGDLPALAARLRAAATTLDAVLRASERQGSLREEDRLDCDRIMAAAADVRDAALSSLRLDSHADTDSVVSAVQIEVAALAAGVRAARG
jgi:hypothetical protein